MNGAAKQHAITTKSKKISGTYVFKSLGQSLTVIFRAISL